MRIAQNENQVQWKVILCKYMENGVHIVPLIVIVT